MLFHSQSYAGLQFVASVHHRTVQCFKHYTNTKHSNTYFFLSLSSFQDAIMSTLRLIGNGMQAVEDARLILYISGS